MSAPNTAADDARYFMERLEAWQDANRDMGDRFAKVLEQRNELLAALRVAAVLIDPTVDVEGKARAMADAAIAKAQG
jgi:hypothetical protein